MSVADQAEALAAWKVGWLDWMWPWKLASVSETTRRLGAASVVAVPSSRWLARAAGVR